MSKLPNGQMAKVLVETRSGKGRLRPDFVDRAEMFGDRCLAVAEELAESRRFTRIIEQIAACGTSVGANVAEADEAMSDKDFRKSLSIVCKELAETRFFLRLFMRRGWISAERLSPLLGELQEIKKIVGSILTKTAPKPRAALTLKRESH